MSNTDISLQEGYSVLRETRGQVAVDWKIKNFFDLPIKKQFSIKSGSFLLSDAEWYLEMYPDGDTRHAASGWISLYLQKKISPSEVHVALKAGIKKADGSEFRSFESNSVCKQKAGGWGRPKLIERSSLFDSKDVVAPDGVLTVFCCAHIQGISSAVGVQTATQASPELQSVENLQRHFKNLFLEERHSDITIKVQGHEFQAHWLILAARSSVFSSMFDHDTAEKQSGIVEITDCSPESFKDFLAFLYTGNIDVVSSSNAISLYKTADKYNVEDLKKECARCMSDELSAESFCDVVLLTTMYDESKLLETATTFFVKNFKTIILTSQWQSFMNQNSTLANELLIKMANNM